VSRRGIVALTGLAVIGLVAFFLWPRHTDDYIAGATGLVVSEDAEPLEGVRVTFHSDEVLYEAITPLKRSQTVTDARGRFAFLFIACGRPGGPYRITFEKEGLQTVHVSGQDSGKHRVVMRATDAGSVAAASRP
jgi:hypothetical protein